MLFVTHSAPPILSTFAEHEQLSTNKAPRAPRPSHVEALVRMYLAAVTDPETGRTNPDREQRVLRVMAL